MSIEFGIIYEVRLILTKPLTIPVLEVAGRPLAASGPEAYEAALR
jgi:hypothetical protein